MSEQYNPTPQTWLLIDAACSGAITADQVRRLEAVLREDQRACDLYLSYFGMHAELSRLACLERCRANILQLIDEPRQATPVAAAGPGGASGDIASPVPFAAPAFLSGAFHGTVGYLASGWPAAYLIATVIVAIGLAVGAITHVSQPVHVARQSLPSPFGRGAGGEGSGTNCTPLPSVVGRITGMVDCRWHEGAGDGGRGTGEAKSEIRNPKSEAISKSPSLQISKSIVSLGDRFNLSSGLLEITYDSGAQVVLQGPVTYEVESGSGGFLSVGKLTARVENSTKYGVRSTEKVDSGQWAAGGKSKIQNPKSEISNPQSLIPNPSPLSTLHSPLFTVRTPTALVTDLGTEFGVEVGTEGNTTSHVFRGVVEVRPTAKAGTQGDQTIRLTENESVRIERHRGGIAVAVHRGKADRAAFVLAEQIPALIRRQRLSGLHRWQAYSRQLRQDPALVAYYTFESAGPNNAVLPNLSSLGRALDGQVEGAEWVFGRLPGKYALYFHGPGSGDRVVLPEQERFKFTGPFSAAVWFKVRQFTVLCQALIAKGDSSWRLHQDRYTRRLSFDTCREPFVAPFYDVTIAPDQIDDGRWHLAVIVCEPTGSMAKKLIYLDGRLAAEGEAPLPLRQNDLPVWLGANSEVSQSEFDGLIDEVAVFSRALSAEDVATMYRAGDNH